MFSAIALCTLLLLLVSFKVDGFKQRGGFSSIHSRASTFRRYNCIECKEGEFDTTVLKSDTPVLVDFYANWCGPCKLMGPIFKALAEEYDGTDPVKFVKVDTDYFDDQVDDYNIQGLPMFGIFVDGKMIKSHSGALNKDQLKQFMAKGLEEHKAKA